MALTVQDIVNATSTDMRSVLANSGADATIIQEYVDRTHKDVLHQSVFAYLNRNTTSVTTVANTANYTLTPADTIRRIYTVFDVTFNHVLTPYPFALAPMVPVQQVEDQRVAPATELTFSPQAGKNTLSQRTQSPYAEYYFLVGTNVLWVFPPPKIAGTLTVFYEKAVATLTLLTSALLVPDDSKDIMVAGTNWLTAKFLGRDADTVFWLQTYEKLKRGEIIY